MELECTGKSDENFHYFFKTCAKGFLNMFYQEVWSKFNF